MTMKCRIAIIDYKTCNISSVIKAFQNANAEVVVVSSLSEYKNIDKIVLPGVGSFGAALLYLKKTNLDSLIIEQSSQKLVLGICLGMQILALKSEESPNETGLGLIQGVVKKFDISKNNELRVPHMGWNHVEKKNNSSLLNNIEDKTDFYFVHSYYLETEPKYVLATTPYFHNFCSIVQDNNIFGCQFHPEKSLMSGSKLIKNFVEF